MTKREQRAYDYLVCRFSSIISAFSCLQIRNQINQAYRRWQIAREAYRVACIATGRIEPSVARVWRLRTSIARSSARTPTIARYRDLTYKSSPITSDVLARPRHRAGTMGVYRVYRRTFARRFPYEAISPRYDTVHHRSHRKSADAAD